MKEFDEKECIDRMRAALPPRAAEAAVYDDDELLNVLDMVWDFYESRGMLDPDDYTDDEPEGEELLADICAYVTKMLRNDKAAKVTPSDVEPLIRAELDYEAELDASL